MYHKQTEFFVSEQAYAPSSIPLSLSPRWHKHVSDGFQVSLTVNNPRCFGVITGIRDLASFNNCRTTSSFGGRMAFVIGGGGTRNEPKNCIDFSDRAPGASFQEQYNALIPGAVGVPPIELRDSMGFSIEL
ncbi:hypothetical protein B0H12DRAFT_1076728 [Mycena haematopus]|nr:hypothetical protein B0H12DRAFT_1076728 [Mycena haematopus]